MLWFRNIRLTCDMQTSGDKLMQDLQESVVKMGEIHVVGGSPYTFHMWMTDHEIAGRLSLS